MLRRRKANACAADTRAGDCRDMDLHSTTCST